MIFNEADKSPPRGTRMSVEFSIEMQDAGQTSESNIAASATISPGPWMCNVYSLPSGDTLQIFTLPETTIKNALAGRVYDYLWQRSASGPDLQAA